MPQFDTSLVWFRRDLRHTDHAALYYALWQSRQVYCVFVFDTDILQRLQEQGICQDRRIDFIRDSLAELDTALRGAGGGLIILHAQADQAVTELARQLQVQAVFANTDYEPQAVARDQAVAAQLQRDGILFFSSKDQVIFEKDEILSQAGKPFSVFTPYKNAWMARLARADGDFFLKAYPVGKYLHRLAAPPAALHHAPPSLAQLGFEASNLGQLKIPCGMSGADALLEDFVERIGAYGTARDYPATKGPSYLSVHLRFGTISIRTLARTALQAMHGGHSGHGSAGAATWLSELTWRDFYFMILHHHPRVAQGQAFKPEYDAIGWEHGPHADERFAAWCQGRTGYPLVDAAMLQINGSGYMHNRLRMVVASFLCKDLGLDWRRGEQYFAVHLNDFDLAANNGGWQWAASSGCDAQPWFRIFNPVTQSEKFDPDGKFIRRYLPQLAGLPAKRIHAPWTATPDELRAAGLVLGRDYPQPIVDHAAARALTLERYAVVKKAEQ